MKANRQAFGEALVELYKSKPNIVSLDADLAAATYSAVFKKEHLRLLSTAVLPSRI